jgi:CheY-like chemotaxis protein
MTNLSGKSILIVGGVARSAVDLRERLVGHGCHVHVVKSFASALMLAHRNRVDVVFVEYAEDAATRSFCADLAAMGIPCIFTADTMTDDAIVIQFDRASPQPSLMSELQPG